MCDFPGKDYVGGPLHLAITTKLNQYEMYYLKEIHLH